jgi:Alpha/beta hydrolase domain
MPARREVAAGSGPQLPDNDAVAGGHRLYQLGGSNHSDSFDAAIGGRMARTHLVQLRARGYPFAEATGAGCSLVTSDVPIAELSRAAMDNLIRWSNGGAVPPRAAPLQLVGPGVLAHDAHGNPLGGIRIAEFDVPRARYDTVPASERAGCGGAPGRTPFYRFDFSAAQLVSLHGSRTGYLKAYRRRTDELVQQHWLLPGDGQRLLAAADRATAGLSSGARVTRSADQAGGGNVDLPVAAGSR